MMIRRVASLGTMAAMVASGIYVFVYLYRWEFNRAIVAGVIFVGAEVALVAAVVLKRLAQLDNRITAMAPTDEHVLQRLRQTAPPPHRPFAWLRQQSGQLSVFVPVLLGAGVALSAVAWVVERVARLTAAATLEAGLARRLTGLSLPDGGLLGPDDGEVDLFSPLG